MGDDAPASSLSAHAASLEQRIRELEALAPQRQHQLELLQQQVDVLLRFRRDIGDILDGLDLRLDRNTQGMLSDRQYIQQLEEAVRDVLVLTAQGAVAAPDAPSAPGGGEGFKRAVADAKALHKRRTPPGKRHLRVVHGIGIGALCAMLWHWSPKRLALGAALTALGVGATVMPGQFGAQPSPAMTHVRPHASRQAQPHVHPSGPAPAAAVHHRRCHDHDGDHDVTAVLLAHREVCREDAADDVAAAPAPASSPAPQSTPAASPDPSPSATPTVTPSAVPSPSSTCTTVPPSTPSSQPRVPASSPPSVGQ